MLFSWPQSHDSANEPIRPKGTDSRTASGMKNDSYNEAKIIYINKIQTR